MPKPPTVDAMTGRWQHDCRGDRRSYHGGISECPFCKTQRPAGAKPKLAPGDVVGHVDMGCMGNVRWRADLDLRHNDLEPHDGRALILAKGQTMRKDDPAAAGIAEAVDSLRRRAQNEATSIALAAQVRDLEAALAMYRRVYRAAKDYARGYCADEAADLDCCVNQDHHLAARELVDAVDELEKLLAPTSYRSRA